MRVAWLGLAALALAQGPPGVFFTDVPAHGLDVVQARPAATSITLSVMAEKDGSGTFSYETGNRRAVQLRAGVPYEIEVTGLAPDRTYQYAIELGGKPVTGSFHTARPEGVPFRFAVQADSHLDGNSDVRVYANTLNNMLKDKADFLVDLGDTFMTDKYDRYQDAEKQYVAQRYYFGLLGAAMPVFLALGNHDGEVGWRGRGGDMTAWASATRRKYFPPMENTYYAWKWGDALFIVLDPFTQTKERARGGDDGWAWTLGQKQYDWLTATLEGSTAKYRFVFLHHLVGGNGKEARGGVEAAGFFEWGGANRDGSRGFEAHRPGWRKPIHDLLVENHVSGVFHGHDHMYVRQERDGIVYQEVPQPSHSRGDATRSAPEYGYVEGKILGGSGHLRVTVESGGAAVEFVRSSLGTDNGEVLDQYTIAGPARKAGTTVVVGRPTDRSATLSVLAAEAGDAVAEYGTQAGRFVAKTAVTKLRAGEPAEIGIGGLQPNTRYHYRVNGVEGSFLTQRAQGSTFTFGVQGDSHPERAGKMFSAELYRRTLDAVRKEHPDFYVMLGDDFSIENLIARGKLSQEAVDRVYAAQCGFLGAVTSSAALFPVNGNHEEAARFLLDGTGKSAAALAAKARNRFLPVPAPDGFYTGDTETVEDIGLLRDYYAWTWGDALFVTIDPYWHSPVQVDADPGGRGQGRGNRAKDLWEVTLGDRQYEWLRRTLETSKAKYKFVFAHHVMGTGRGAIELADYFEWGGKDRRGNDLFREKRPTWEMPIHQLMAKTGVTIFFQGHDHLFAHQEKDGVVYQETPNPADDTYTAFNREAYRSGDVLPNAGHLKVTVSPENVRVDYVRAYLEKDAETAFTYSVKARGSVPGR